jgi:hypothetical protein
MRIPSEYNPIFCELGYPELDILRDESGEWHIIQYLNGTAIPSLTRWQPVLTRIKGVIITKSILEKFCKELDITRKEFWAREEAKSKLAEDEFDAKERHAAEYVDKAHEAITRNPDLMERIAKNGIKEMNLDQLQKHVPVTEYSKPLIKPVEGVTTCHTSSAPAPSQSSTPEST